MYRWVRPLLFMLDAETAHHVAIRAGRILQALPAYTKEDPPELGQKLLGASFTNPIGIAAGLDKNGVCIPYWERIGCGFAEIGSVSVDPAPGNPKPRAFRLPADQALINRMGLNNDGAATVADRIKSARRAGFPLGINIVKTNRPGLEGETAVDDFCRGFAILAPLADYIALNVSCPNTDDGKTFEDPAALDDLLQAIMNKRRELRLEVPVLVKLSPPDGDIEVDGEFHELLAVSERHEVDGYIATNTTLSRDGLQTSSARLGEIGSGGLSGKPLADRSRRLLHFLYRRTSGSKPIVSVGGIDSPEEAVHRIYLGASLVQVYTGLVYEGPGLVRRLKTGIVEALESDGIPNIAAAIGRLA